MLRIGPYPRRDVGSAMIAAVILMLLASFVIVAITVSSISSRDNARAVGDDAASQELARTASTVLSAAYSTLASGEQDGFVPSKATLTAYTQDIAGAQVLDNATLPANLQSVDANRVPAWGRFTVQQPASDGKAGFWQVYSVKLPKWGITKAGRVTVFVRTWTRSQTTGTTSKPALYRLEFRPGWFADYEMLFDGPVRLGAGATLNGRVHSNGYFTSFFNQYSTWGDDRIRIDAGVTCSTTTRITTSTGNIAGVCPGQSRAGKSPRINILRARDLANTLRSMCLGASAHPGVQMLCPATTSQVDVTLSGSTVSVAGYGNLNAAVAGDLPGQNQGAVVVLAGNARIRGTLANNARALVVTASPLNTATSSNYGTGSAPSVYVESSGSVGASGSRQSSFGIVAEGDVIFDERVACPVTFRGAIVTMTGLTSIHPTWRVPFYTAGGSTCGGIASIQGSIVGHFPPLMKQDDNNAGYAMRRYAYLPGLYDNPPPLYPTAADWEVTNFAQANLDCFQGAANNYTLNATAPGCS